MYNARGFRESEIGDIDVIRVGDTYHLFHLVLPNHDYIAHTVSTDCMNWKPTRNAIFTGDPGEWDDDMLWTMHVTHNPKLNCYEMFYTGLQRRENGNLQRVGRAVSDDLIEWRKENIANLPLAPQGEHYEQLGTSERQWVSFRDPFLYREGESEWILVCARVPEGVINRRGCVGLIRRDEEGFETVPNLFFPRVYDDVECPCAVEIDGTHYLIGSIREDVKVHYWFADSFLGDYRAFRNNVLMPRGNYAARVTRDGDKLLLYSFYIDGIDVERSHRTLPPPKQLERRSDNQLTLTSYWRWDEKRGAPITLDKKSFHPHLKNPTAESEATPGSLSLSSVSGYEIFTTKAPAEDFIWEGNLKVVHRGKCGFIFNFDEGLNGYFLSLDTIRGIVQIRGWGARPDRIFKDYTYHNLQENEFTPSPAQQHSFKLIRWGGYIELSLDGAVVLSLVNSHFTGDRIGLYTESVSLLLTESRFYPLDPPEAEFG